MLRDGVREDISSYVLEEEEKTRRDVLLCSSGFERAEKRRR